MDIFSVLCDMAIHKCCYLFTSVAKWTVIQISAKLNILLHAMLCFTTDGLLLAKRTSATWRMWAIRTSECCHLEGEEVAPLRVSAVVVDGETGAWPVYRERKADRAVDASLEGDINPRAGVFTRACLTVSTETASSSGSILASITQTPWGGSTFQPINSAW